MAEEFAKCEYESYILVDFTEASQEVRDLFNDISDLDNLLFRLQSEEVLRPDFASLFGIYEGFSER